MRRSRLVLPMLIGLLLPTLFASPVAAYPPISKEEALLYGNNPDPLQPGEDASGVGSVGRKTCVTTGEPGSVPGVDKDISCDDNRPATETLPAGTFAPDNELAIVAHPENADILLAGSNDYQLYFNGATVVQRVPAGYFLSFDAGETWIDGQVPMQASFGAGDPAPAFDTRLNRALMASLSFVCGQGALYCSRGNLAVAYLDLDKARAEIARAAAARNPQQREINLPWQDQMVVNGDGSDIAAVQIFSDKEWLTVDNNRTIPTPDPNDGNATMANPNFGNYYLVYARFRSEHGAYDESPIFFTKSEDGGANWTDPVEISGRSLTKCTFQDDPNDSADTTGDFNESGVSETPDDPNACDQDQFAYPVVAPDGTLYVHFHNEQNSQAYETPQRYDSQIMLVRSDDGGDTWYGDPDPAEQAGCVPNPLAAEAGTDVVPGPAAECIVPIHIVDLEDSYDTHEEDSTPPGATAIPDYPINVQGRTTLTNMQFRVNSAGTITVAPAVGGDADDYRLYVVYADNCAGVRPGVGQTNPIEEDEDPNTPPAFVPVTDTNLYYAYSDDHGQTWIGGDGPENNRPYNTCGSSVQGQSGGLAGSGRLIARPGSDAQEVSHPDDQWFPWADGNRSTTGGPGPVAPAGVVAVTMDGNAHDGFPARETYGFTGWTTGSTVIGQAPDFESIGNLSGAPSRPRQARFFRTQPVDPTNECPDCTRFLGDYNGVAVDLNGRVHAVWTDMRRGVQQVQRPVGCDTDPTTPAEPCVTVNLATEDAYYARRPSTVNPPSTP